MIKKKSSHFICAWQWLMLSSETMRRKLEIQKLEQVFRFFSFSFIPPLFFKHSPPESGWILWDLFVAAHCRGWLMISYLVRSDFMDSSLVSSGSYIFSWMRIRGSFLISVSVKKRSLVLCVTVKGYLSISNIQISPVPWVNASKSIQSCVLQQ